MYLTVFLPNMCRYLKLHRAFCGYFLSLPLEQRLPEGKDLLVVFAAVSPVPTMETDTGSRAQYIIVGWVHDDLMYNNADNKYYYPDFYK